MKMFAKMLTGSLVLALSASMVGCGQSSAPEQTATSTAAADSSQAAGTLLLSVNPEIEIGYDEEGKVLTLLGKNKDGEKIVKTVKDFEGDECEDVLEDLVEKIYEEGYFETKIDGHVKNIVLKLEEGSVYPDDDFLEGIADCVRVTIENCGVASTPMTVTDDDLDDQGRIGIEKARQLALAQLGLENAEFSEGEYDLDDNIYELEFTHEGTEYEYEIDAVNGKVKKADRDHNHDWDAWDDDDDKDDNDKDDDDDDRDDDDDDRNDSDDDRDDKDDDKDDDDKDDDNDDDDDKDDDDKDDDDNDDRR